MTEREAGKRGLELLMRVRAKRTRMLAVFDGSVMDTAFGKAERKRRA